jgi:hypothetical protein
MSPKKIEELD